MATLPKTAPYYKRFLNGDKGHSHAAQEFGVITFFTVLLGFFSTLAPVLVLLLLLLSFKVRLTMVGDKYWIQREVQQSLAKGRNPTEEDLTTVPSQPNGFWTADAIDDVKFPRKARPYNALFVAAYMVFLYSRFGL